jgi:hypothetical protein
MTRLSRSQVDQRATNNLQNRFSLLQHLVVPKSQHRIAILLQPRGASFIFLLPEGMLAAVYFHDQHSVQTDEVGDEGPDGTLAAEFATFDLPLFQSMPQGTLGIRHAVAQMPGLLNPVHGFTPSPPS